ncbi:uncharacterized protein LOC110984488 [Acanthaster planci]|uniref:Uncharacterized protein LOC110984488 n=1 Tax=Acanthaster planci TaxID=133434 RepID=A0A8B7Z454_ACAPL|nr:uncharacterized protein LOC110984488 [Acanthaster planci]
MAADNRNNSHISNYELMETIRKYEAIYNTSGEYHKAGKMLKKDAWAAVADELNLDIAEVQNRYGNIRTVFSRYLKKIRREQAGGVGPGTSRLGDDISIKEGFEYLRWLIPHIRPRNTTGEQEPQESDDGEDPGMWSGDKFIEAGGHPASSRGDVSINMHRLSHVPSASHLTLRASTLPRRSFHAGTSLQFKRHVRPKAAKRPWLAVNGGARKARIEDSRGSGNNGSSNDDDEDMMFCMSLVPKMRRLPEKFKTSAQLRILQVVCDFEGSGSDALPSQLPTQTTVVFPTQAGSWQPPIVALPQPGQTPDTQPTSQQ